MIKGKLLRAMIDTGSFINIITKKFGENGPMELNEGITLNPCQI